MENRVLNNGMKIPVIGIGTFPYKEELYNALPIALNAGYRLIDTSDNYQNENYIGNVYQKLESTQLNNIITITKFSQPYQSHFFYKVFKRSQKALYSNTKHNIDIYLLHWPYPFLWKKHWKKMERLYQNGQCKAIGVCNFEKKNLEKLLDICTIKPMINQIECHPMFQQKETIEFCKNNNIQVMSYSPFARMDTKLIKNNYLCKLAEKYGKHVQQIILRWNIQKGLIPIPASVSKKHIISNFDIFDFELTDDEINGIDNLECGMRVRFDPKTRFTTKQKILFWVCSLIEW